jgi:hypothetical protein
VTGFYRSQELDTALVVVREVGECVEVTRRNELRGRAAGPRGQAEHLYLRLLEPFSGLGSRCCPLLAS